MDRKVQIKNLDKQNIRLNRQKIKKQFKQVLIKNLNQSSNSIQGQYHQISKKLEQIQRSFVEKTQLDCVEEIFNTISVDLNIDDYFQVREKIGAGSQSIVYKCIQIKSRKTYAIKVIKLCSDQIIQNILETYLIMKTLNHENIIQTYKLFIQPQKRTCYIITQLCEFGDLRSYLRNIKDGLEQELDITHVSKILQKILSALLYLKEKNICHRDIRPQNIIYNPKNQSVKLIDFSISSIGNNEENIDLWSNTGSVFYRAPETFNGSYDERIDIWSVGVIAYELIYHTLPFYHQYRAQLKKKICSQNLEINHQDKLPESCKDFLQKILCKNRDERLTPQLAMQHKFIKSLNQRKDRKNSNQQTDNESQKIIKSQKSIEKVA